jgi:hypothetical protein
VNDRERFERSEGGASFDGVVRYLGLHRSWGGKNS